jgi:hypothetical protein
LQFEDQRADLGVEQGALSSPYRVSTQSTRRAQRISS